MIPCLARRHTPFWGAHKESFSDQIRLAHRFHGLRFLTDHGRQVVQTDRTAVEIGDNGFQYRNIQTIQALGINLVQCQRLLDIVRMHSF